jgi:glycosyltransferase involved in cell wall biosynthesis
VSQTKSLVNAALSRVPSRLAHRQDVRYRVFSARSDLALIRFMRSLSGGVVIGDRPSLNLVLARHAPPDVIAVGQEHLHLSKRSPRLRQSFLRHYAGLDALTTLTEGDAQDYRELLGAAVRVAAMPEAVTDLGAVRAALHPQTKVVVAAGRLTQERGFDRLITAFAWVNRAHPDWRLDIYGVGPAAEALQTRIDGKGLAEVVRLRGFSRDLPQRFAESAIFALSSRSEGFPMALVEAMGCGLPLVGFDCPSGPADIIRDGSNGLLVPDGDVEKLAAAINQLIEEPALRQRMGAAGVELAGEYAADRVAVRWERFFEELSVAPRRRTGGTLRRA